MKKPMLVGLAAAVAALGLLFVAVRSAVDGVPRMDPSAIKNLTISIGDQEFTLSEGLAERPAAPGSAAIETVRMVGEPVPGDVTGDGKTDAALVIRHEPGGSGVFYYAVIAVNEAGSYRATNAVPLGDRIKTQRIEVMAGGFAYHILERGPGQPMADAPTVARTVPIVFDPRTGSISPLVVFPRAAWLWDPIADQPPLADDSAVWAGHLSAPGTQHLAELYQEAARLVPAAAVGPGTPRYDVKFTEPWGSDPFGGYTVPIPGGTAVPQYAGGDGHLAIQDPVSGQVFGLWQARFDPATNAWTASWGGMAPIGGNGVDTSGSATATNLSRYAGVVTAAEMTAAIAAGTGLGHALVFASDIAGPGFVGPATKSDGTNIARVGTPIPEGSRVQLDPGIDVEAIPGITPGEKVIAKTLQTHGAYVVDQGAARMAFAFEALPDAGGTNPGKAWIDAGFGWDYFDMRAIPWSELRVLAP